jgi:hypothetical protein
VKPKTLLIVAIAAWPARALASGFEIPDNGTEALGRGGAFTAKADDGTALEYNVAGLAQQRGTRLLLDANLWPTTPAIPPHLGAKCHSLR